MIIEIGRCKGCDQRARLDRGVCKGCLVSPRRGRRWAEISHRCRTDPEFARSVYLRIESASGRAIFRAMYGHVALLKEARDER